MTLKQGESEVDLPYQEEAVIVNPDDLLPAVAKLEKYASNDIVFNRQAVVRNLLETLRGSVDNQDEINRIVTVMCNLSEDYEPSVRAELMEQVPHLAGLCNENRDHLGNVIQLHLVPMIIKYLRDINNQVRKRTQATLLIMVEQGLINEADLEEEICPVVLQLTESSHLDDHRSEAITLMSKLSSMVGKEMTEKLFMECFGTLCLDSSFHVRKVCALSLGDFCNVIGEEDTEEILLPKFFLLCEDGVWGVRKACAEVFMPVSCVCSMETRHKELTPLFMKLLCDQSRWVRVAAFQALGPFISTFADPIKTGLYYSKDGMLTAVDVPENSTQKAAECALYSENESLINSHNSRYSSSICRTDLVSNDQCDIPVPSYQSENDSASIQPQVEPFSSTAYCTVIEVSSPFSPEIPVESQDVNSVSCDKKIILSEKTDVNDVTAENANSPSQQENIISNHLETDEENESLWHECLYANVASEVVISNGEVVNEVEVHSASNLMCDEISSSDEDNICLGELSKNLFRNNIDVRHATKGEVTVNGVAINSDNTWEDPADCMAASGESTESSLSGNSSSVYVSGCNSLCVVDGSESPESLCASENMISEHSIQNSSSEENIPNHVPEVTTNLCNSHIISNSSETENRDIPHNEGPCDSQGDDESAFNHFQYWRTPIPDVDVDVKAEDSLSAGGHFPSMSCDIKVSVQRITSPNAGVSKIRDVPVTAWSSLNTNSCSASSTENNHENTAWEWSTLQINKISSNNITVAKEGAECNLSHVFLESFHGEFDKDGEPPPTSQQYISAHDQDIIPPDLLLRYLSMTDASRAQTVDAEIARHCAYSFPAVALTLGRNYWPCLKETYETLASDMQGFIMQWKVRRTLASSMHQLAVILGPDISAADLLPIFLSFIRDLDEVRIGILQHLSEFLAVLYVEARKELLPRIAEFLNPDNEKNWRFRLIFAEQLIPTADLYDPTDVREFLVPLTLALIRDRVCEVRLAAVRVLAAMMRCMSRSCDAMLTKTVLLELSEEFINAHKWLYRQVYVYMCQEFIKSNSLPADQFAEDVLPHLLYLSWDQVPNVRLAVARCLAVHVWPLENFSHPQSSHRDLLLQALHTLQSDMDADVRYFANMVATDDCSCLQHSGALNDTSEPPV